MSNFIPLPPTYAISDPQVRAVLDVLTRNMQVVIEAGGGTTTNTALTTVGGGSSFGSANTSTNITNLAPSYTLDTLTADLKRGAAEVITGALNGTTIMKLEPAGQYVVFQHKDAVVLGTTGAYAGTVRTALGITSTGILGGYNRQSDGAWQTTFAIESATGNLTLLGTIRAASVISVDAYLGSTLVSDVVTNSAAVTTKLNKSAADILSGSITFSSAGGFKTGTISIDGSGNATGAGVAITSKGIVGRTDAATTFTIDATTGAATFKGDITGASGTFGGDVSAGNVLSTGATLGTTSGTNFWLRGSDGAAYFGGETTVKGRFTVSGSFALPGYGDIGGYFTTNAGGATIYAVNSGTGWTINATNSSTGGAGVFYNTTSGTFGTPTLWAINYGSAVAFRAQSTGQAALFSSSGGGYAFIANSTGATGASAFVQGDFALGYSNSRGDPWIIRAPSTSVAAAASYYLNSDGTFKTTASIVPSLSSDSNALGGYAPSSWARIFATNSGTANAGGSGVNLLGSTSTGIAGAYVGTSGTSNIVTFTVQTTSPSDVRLKEEIANSDLGLAFVKQLRPVSYKLKADPKHQKGYGFIADEVEQVIGLNSSLVYYEPDWQVGDETGFKTIHYPSYVAVLTKAIQELSAEVELLKAGS
jgi:hypothetical protein